MHIRESVGGIFDKQTAYQKFIWVLVGVGDLLMRRRTSFAFASRNGVVAVQARRLVTSLPMQKK
jgi:hypothetical protein